MLSHHTCTVDGMALHYAEAGEGRGAPVLLLHGWPTSAELWRHAMPHIGAHRRVIALDLPGFGRSDKPLDRRYSWSFFDGVLSGFLDALGLDRVGLVVHDMGGPVGLHWAVSNSERVTDLTLMNTLVFPEMSWAVKAFLVAVRTPGLSWAMTSAWGLQAGMKLGVVDKGRIDAGVAARYQAPFAGAPAREALLHSLRGISPRGFHEIAAGLGGFDVPVHLLYGTRDVILPDVAATMDRVAAALPQATRDVLPDCGHFLQEDQPERVAELLAAALGRHRVAAAA
jgi:pimeloyl-ACP methyl ester carboxylesterase